MSTKADIQPRGRTPSIYAARPGAVSIGRESRFVDADASLGASAAAGSLILDPYDEMAPHSLYGSTLDLSSLSSASNAQLTTCDVLKDKQTFSLTLGTAAVPRIVIRHPAHLIS